MVKDRFPGLLSIKSTTYHCSKLPAGMTVVVSVHMFGPFDPQPIKGITQVD